MSIHCEKTFIKLANHRVIILLILFIVAFGCSDSNLVQFDLEQLENDPSPYFDVTYSRTTTKGSNGLIESINVSLSHIVKNKLVDYGTVSFGDLELLIETDPEEIYHNSLQSNLSGNRRFSPEFRFDMGNLFFKANQSSMVEDINQELYIPTVSYITNMESGQIVNPSEDLSIEVNRVVFGVDIILNPLEPIDETDNTNFLVIQLRDPSQLFAIPASQLQVLKSKSKGNRYILYYTEWQMHCDVIEVNGKNSNKTVEVPVIFSSEHTIDFVMEN